jgi:hypothetical protein
MEQKQKFLQDELDIQRKRPEKDRAYITLIEAMMDKDIQEETYLNTGRIMTSERWRRNFDRNFDKELRSDCYDVIRYAGGFIIQMLRPREWYLDFFDGSEPIQTPHISEAEKAIWKKVKSVFK